MSVVVEAESLVKTYPGKVTLYNFSVKINQGGIFGLLGPNGAGKSTFIRILAGLEEADSGKVMLFGKPASGESRKKIGVVPQENAIYPLLTCMENLLYFGSLYGVTGKKANEKAERLLADLGLAEKKNVQTRYLSGGMARRLNLACALMHEPKLIILDEPTTGLDPVTRRKMWKTITELIKDNETTILLTTHYMEEAEALCDRIAFINAGQVVAEGSPEELKKMAGREMAKVKSLPGEYAKLEPAIRAIKGIENVTATEHGIVVESDNIASKVSEITKAFTKGKEKIIELSVSKPSLEDVFLKLTGAQLKEAVKVETKK
ncbi:MAG: ABC transporter ATP-binding protein [Candidatus Bilamarchaeaceae archaeon]